MKGTEYCVRENMEERMCECHTNFNGILRGEPKCFPKQYCSRKQAHEPCSIDLECESMECLKSGFCSLTNDDE